MLLIVEEQLNSLSNVIVKKYIIMCFVFIIHMHAKTSPFWPAALSSSLCLHHLHLCKIFYWKGVPIVVENGNLGN